MTTRSTLVAWLFYSGLACCLVVIVTFIFFDKDASAIVSIVSGTAGIGFCILTGAAVLLAYPEYGYPPTLVWAVFSALSLASIIIPPFGQFDQGGGWIRLAPLCFAVCLYGYKRLFVAQKKSS